MAKPSTFRCGARKNRNVKLLDISSGIASSQGWHTRQASVQILKYLYSPCWLYAIVGCVVAVALGLTGCTAATSPATLLSSAASPASAPVTITDIAAQTRNDELHITIDATRAVQYTAVSLSDPLRLVVDIEEAVLAPDLQPLALPDGIASAVEPVIFPDRDGVRLLVPLRQAATHRVEADGQQMHITLTKAPAVPAQTSERDLPPILAAPTPAVQAADTAAPSSVPGTHETLPATPTVVTGVEFRSLPGASEIAVQITGTLPQMRIKQLSHPLRLTLDVADARLSPSQDHLMAVHDPTGVVSQLQAMQSSTQPDAQETVHIVAYLHMKAPFEVRQEANQVRVILTQPVMQTATAEPATVVPPLITASEPATLLAGAPLIAQATPAAPGAAAGVPEPIAPATITAHKDKKYTGEKISLDFQNADINDILRLIAEVSGLNIISGPDVKGTVTTRMVDVPWDQALEVVLRINGLDQDRADNIVRVAPVERFITERQERLRAQQAEVQAEPTVTQVVPISYADVNELKTNLERVLSGRGSIWVDTRTHTLVLTDVQVHVDKALALVKTLDRQTPQVMIESRIVEASRQFLRELGVQLGTRVVKTTDRNFPSTIAIDGGVSSASADGTSAGNFLVDLPAAVGQGQGGAISFALAGAGSLLNVQLSALENSGQGKVITNPKIATLDNTEALIESGRRIPYATISDEGTRTEFADASIKLRVTPNVAPDGFIDLKIHATKNEADFSRTSANGVPTILTREATTEMLVQDGDTVVIGGLYQRTLQSASRGVPWLSRIPVLGWLFKTKRKEDNHEELLIFITPRIIKQPDVPGQAQALLYN
ncbi:MAG: type IV pilus secretin PilQ [Candidatus Tectomicrobia bacterium]|nr:type IV pilus secretin PilQ [Candidatus Tectomicrobia bacterium]